MRVGPSKVAITVILALTSDVVRAQPPGATVILGPVSGGNTFTLVATAPAASTGPGYLTVYDATNSQFRLVINPAGNVGIGTTAPVTRLDVRGTLTLEAGGSPGLFTGTGNSELNRYLTLLNSTGYPSASGLKAGGILVADDYSYADPAKNDLVVKGNAEQSRTGAGFAKAMLVVHDNGAGNVATIVRCFNGVTNVSSGSCGFFAAKSGPIGNVWEVDFGFTVSDRFVVYSGVYPAGVMDYVDTSVLISCGSACSGDFTVIVF
jgi:hypothetical protein